jgi:deoxycytidine triphosphate deaminase
MSILYTKVVGDDLKSLASEVFETVDDTLVEYDSVILRVGNKAYLERDFPLSQQIHTMRKENWGELYDVMNVAETADASLYIKPKQFLLLETLEYFRMPKDVWGVLNLRSWAALSGLEQSTSLDIKPEWEGYLKMELVNQLRYNTLRLEYKAPIASVKFFKL